MKVKAKSVRYALGQLDDPAWQQAIALFQDARAKLNWLEAKMRESSGFARDHGREVTELESSYQSWRDAFTTAYRARFGTVPVGLAALPAVGTIITIAVVLTALAALIYEANRLISLGQQYVGLEQTKAETQQQAASTGQAMLIQANALDTQGRGPEAAALREQALALIREAQGTSFEDIKPYLPYILLGGGALAAVLIARR